MKKKENKSQLPQSSNVQMPAWTHYNCLDIITSKGMCGETQKWVDAMASVRGIKISKVNRVGPAD